MPEPTDEQLLSDYRQGDRSALVAIVERHEIRLARIAYRITGCRHEAEDVRHAVFVRFLQSIERTAEVERIGAWLTRCTVNEAVTRMRKRSRHVRVISDLAQLARASTDSSLMTRLLREESDEHLTAALAKLSPDDRALLSLRFDEDLTFRGIAEVLERPASTVKSQMSQAISRLRELLNKSR